MADSMRTRTHEVEQAVARLNSLHDELAVFDVIAQGEQAIPALRAILFKRERSGLYQTRCRAVEALSAFGAYNVLIEFLAAEREIIDPIERVGEDAVVNAAALVLARVRERRVLDLLLQLARRPALTGVIGALGAFESIEAIPALINALEEDASRLTAESALRKLGQQARPALLRTVNAKVPSADSESESSARRRRSALALLAEMDSPEDAWPQLQHLTRDKDAKLAARACEVELLRAPASEQRGIIRRLIELLGDDDWVLREEIETFLQTHFDSTREVIINSLNETPQSVDKIATRNRRETILRRIIARMHSAPRL